MPSAEYPRIPLRARDGSIRAWALVDPTDYPAVDAHRWCLAPGGYVVRRKGDQTVYLHRELLGLKRGVKGHVDHLNGDKLDNRRGNLVHGTAAQNQVTRRRPGNNRSGCRGVYWSKARGVWVAQITHQKKTRFLGHFDELADAVAARKAAERLFFGEECPSLQASTVGEVVHAVV